jgi:hypothetical protein
MAAPRSFIVGFIHVYMVNEWEEILMEQIKLMSDSGLYNEMRCANICCIGTEQNMEHLKEIIKPITKLQFAAWSSNASEYEFLSLRFIKDVCDRGTTFYGFYIHSKGVSWPGHEGGKYWRDYMNHYIITRWKDDVKMLDMGHETCGVKIVHRNWPLHYSGNFFWFKAEYVKLCVPVSSMNLKDRFNAEMWIGSGRPIAGTLCQDFVDYDTKGIFTAKDDQLPGK